jgi:hypothetical protein
MRMKVSSAVRPTISSWNVSGSRMPYSAVVARKARK